jgi:putative nucleotidyltransferase with HDIG domain
MQNQPSSQTHIEFFASRKAFMGWCLTCFSGVLALYCALSTSHVLSPGLQIGDIADRDLASAANATVKDPAATRQLMDDIKQTLIPIFQLDKSRDTDSELAIKKSLTRMELLHQALWAAGNGKKDKVLSGPNNLAIKPELEVNLLLANEKTFISQSAKFNLLQKEQLQKLRSTVQEAKVKEPSLSETEILLCLLIPAPDFPKYKDAVLAAIYKLNKKFHRFPVNNKRIWEGTIEEFLPEEMKPEIKQVTTLVLANTLEPNLVIDHEATRIMAQDAVKAIKPVTQEIKDGQIIVARGVMISQDKLEILQELGITNQNRWPFVLSIGVSLIAAVSLIGFFMLAFEPKHFVSTQDLGLIFAISVATTAAAALIGKLYPSFVPIPALALTLSIFFGRHLALAVTLPLILLLGVDQLFEIHNLIAALIASLVAIFSYNRSRTTMITTGLFIAFSLTLSDLALMSLTNLASEIPIYWPTLVKTLTLDLLGGITSSIVAIGSLPFLEKLFGLITPFRLAELTDANQPLLRRLEENAPGTYQHSLAVANLAEAGAKAIQADANMVRAGALYHDIGKMVRPKFFIENQLGAVNPHDSLEPEESKARVLAHVSDGIALAQKYQLPKAIQDFIPMHQGTTLMAYFYHKACQRDGADKVDPEFYRYPGPRPNTKETAIVMLADVSEAVTHSMKAPSQEEVEQALEKVFLNRWDDGQFQDTNMTLEELHKVKDGFCRVWRTLHHERLKYPATTTGKMPIAPEQENKEIKTAN